jgi:hypothetical protein
MQPMELKAYIRDYLFVFWEFLFIEDYILASMIQEEIMYLKVKNIINLRYVIEIYCFEVFLCLSSSYFF